MAEPRHPHEGSHSSSSSCFTEQGLWISQWQISNRYKIKQHLSSDSYIGQMMNLTLSPASSNTLRNQNNERAENPKLKRKGAPRKDSA